MKNIDDFQSSLFKQYQEGQLLETAFRSGNKYIADSVSRHIYPLDSDLSKLSQFEESVPESIQNPSEVLGKLIDQGGVNTVNQIGGRYFGFVNGGVIPVGLAAKILASYWDQNAAMHVISPISSKLEEIVEKWLVEMFNLPSETVAGFVSGTSMANFSALAAARYRVLKNNNWDIQANGLNGAPRIRIILSDRAHSSIHKAVSLMGFGERDIERIETDNQGRMLEDKLPELDSLCIIVLGAGNVNTGAFDPFDIICKKANEANCWVHIDGAFGLWAAASNQFNHLTQGINLASSWSVDGHKTLNTPYDSGIVLCADKEALVAALHMSASYLVLSQQRDNMFFTPEMSRRSRIIELWAILKFLGREGIDLLLSLLHERAKQFAELAEKIEGISIVNDVVFNQVLLACENNMLTETTLKHLQNDRVCWAGGSQWQGKKVIRISVCSWATTTEDVKLSVDSLKRSLEKSKSLK